MFGENSAEVKHSSHDTLSGVGDMHRTSQVVLTFVTG